MPIHILKNNQQVNIRTAEEKDALELVNMFNTLGGESENLTFGYNDYYFNENQQKLLIRTMNERTNSLFLVATIDNKIVGYLTFTTMQRERLVHRGDMGVATLKAYWGLGIGAFLIEELFNWVEKNESISKIELQVRVDNKRAIDLYTRWGFVIEGRIARGIKVEDKYYDLYNMGKCIGGC